MNKIVCCLLPALLSAISLSAQSRHGLLRKGDRQYDQEHYKEAEQFYRDAADRKYGDPKRCTTSETASINKENGKMQPYDSGNRHDWRPIPGSKRMRFITSAMHI